MPVLKSKACIKLAGGGKHACSEQCALWNTSVENSTGSWVFNMLNRIDVTIPRASRG